MDTICIMCPVGCSLTITETDGVVSIKGNACPRGKKFGEEEFKAPKRTVTTVMLTKKGDPFSVKTDAPVPKNKIFEILRALKSIEREEALAGEVIAENICGSGARVVVTRGTK